MQDSHDFQWRLGLVHVICNYSLHLLHVVGGTNGGFCNYEYSIPYIFIDGHRMNDPNNDPNIAEEGKATVMKSGDEDVTKPEDCSLVSASRKLGSSYSSHPDMLNRSCR
jgi:hypothetical protein